MSLQPPDGNGGRGAGGGRMTSASVITTIAGRQFELRRIRPEDADGYDRLVATLSPEDRRYRFFSAFARLPASLRESLTNVDHETHEAFVAAEFGPIRNDPARDGPLRDDIGGVVRMIVDADGAGAEYAIVVSRRLRGVGLGFALMQYVIDYARYAGLSRLHGDVMTENKAMMQMCRELGFTPMRHPDDPTVSIVTLAL